MSEPLSPERLAKIREDAETYRCTPNNASFYWAAADSAADVPLLLAEVERLRAELAVAVDVLTNAESDLEYGESRPAFARIEAWHRAHGWTGTGMCDYCAATDAWMPKPDGSARAE